MIAVGRFACEHSFGIVKLWIQDLLIRSQFAFILGLIALSLYTGANRDGSVLAPGRIPLGRIVVD